MPGRDQTGPMGAGPMSGRGAGICGGASGQDTSGRGFGPTYGRGMGRGGRIGRRWLGGFGFRGRRGLGGMAGAVSMEKDAELAALKSQAEAIERELELIRNRMQELEAQGK